MSITVLITGRLVDDPACRADARGNAFALATLAARTGAGNAALITVNAFGGLADQLLEMSQGDAIALTGSAIVAQETGDAKAQPCVRARALLTGAHLQRLIRAMDGKWALMRLQQGPFLHHRRRGSRRVERARFRLHRRPARRLRQLGTDQRPDQQHGRAS